MEKAGNTLRPEIPAGDREPSFSEVRISQRLLLLMTLMSSLLANCAGLSTKPPEVRRDLLHPRPHWVTGTAGASNGSLLIAHSIRLNPENHEERGNFRRAVYAYAPNGELQEILSTEAFPNLSSLEVLSDGDIIFENEDGQMVLAREKLEDAHEIINLYDVIIPDENGQKWQIGGVFRWAVSENYFIGLTDLVQEGTERSNPKNWITAVVIGPLHSKTEFQIVQKFESDGPVRSLSLLGNNYFTSLQDKLYFLEVDAKNPVEYQIYAYQTKAGEEKEGSPKSESLKDSEAKGQLCYTNKDREAKDRFETAEHTDGPVALFSGEAFLFVLEREGTNWYITTIEPDSQKRVNRFLVDSAARHLTPAYQNGSILLIERGEVSGLGIQDIPSIITIPQDVVTRSPSAHVTTDPEDCVPHMRYHVTDPKGNIYRRGMTALEVSALFGIPLADMNLLEPFNYEGWRIAALGMDSIAPPPLCNGKGFQQDALF